MIRRLKLQFVAISLALTGLVLFAVLGSTYYTSWSTQHDIVDEALDRALMDDLDHMPMMGDFKGPQDGHQKSLLAVAVDVSLDGTVIQTSHVPVAIDEELLAEVVQEALDSEKDCRFSSSGHIAWKRRYLFEGVNIDALTEEDDLGYDAQARIAIVDTSAMDSTLSRQLKGDLVITAVAFVALVGISWLLASWAVAPVARAWEEQRRFVADASHELKTPLAVIMANTEILRNDTQLGEESRRWIESTADEASHMRSLVQDLLELARTDDAGSTAFHKEDVDLSDVVGSAALEFDAIAFERGCLIEEDIEEGIHLQGDLEWLERLAKILIDNACKYAEEGSTIDVRLSKTQGKACLSVTNRGNPIDPDDLDHVFDRFYRSDKARARETGGFGLGLAIAKGIAERHGGKISATSSALRGTTFTVTL